jgi:hypothetical protein
MPEIVEVNSRSLIDVIESIYLLRDKTTKENITSYCDISDKTAENSLLFAIELKLIQIDADKYVSISPLNRIITNAKKNDRKNIFKFLLLEYPPFLFFIEQIERNEDPTQAAIKTKTVFSMTGSATILKNSFIELGLYSKILNDTDGGYTVIHNEDTDFNLIFESITKTLMNDEQAGEYISSLFDARILDYISEYKSRLITSSSKFESDRKTSILESADIFEDYLKKITSDLGISLKKINGIIEIGNELKRNDKICNKHLGYITYIGQIRNALKHTTDTEIGRSWEISDDLPLNVFLTTIQAINSITLYVKHSVVKL